MHGHRCHVLKPTSTAVHAFYEARVALNAHHDDSFHFDSRGYTGEGMCVSHARLHVLQGA